MQQRGWCLGCAYDLRGSDGKQCPECGRPFDPDDPTTFATGAALTGWHRQAAGPLAWTWIAISIVLALIACHAVSVPGDYFLEVILVMFCWWLLGAFWVLRLAFAVGLRFWRGLPWSDGFGKWWRWALPPLIAALTIVMIELDAPMRLRFAFASGTLEQYAQQAMTQQPGPQNAANSNIGPQRIGGYQFEHIEVLPNKKGVIMLVDDSGFLGRGGFGWFPSPPGPQPVEALSGIVVWAQPMHGNWYRLHEEF